MMVSNVTQNDTAGTSQSDMIYEQFKLAESNTMVLFDIMFPVSAIVGLPGSVLTFATVLTMPRSASNFYVAVMSFGECLILLIHLLRYALCKKTNFKYELCHNDVILFAWYFILVFLNWMLVLINFQRFIIVCFPLRSKCITFRRAQLSVGVLVLLLAVLTFIQIERRTFDHPTVVFTDIIFISLLPWLFMFVFTVCIIVVLQKANKRRNQLVNTKELQRCKKAGKSLTVVMVTAAFLFMLFNFPICATTIYDIVATYLDMSIDFYVLFMFYQVTCCLTTSSYAFHCYLYVLSMRKFRVHLIRLATCVRRQKN